ncbi:PREDICTED: uncharacterized protein LOC108360679 [Rhagoletis zephyria]|uniref:uncharacterized protein LOC108360679 n=1 Tax=Rhagoletis zephyria TaxID=28612 RepID=UPI000811926B|nr:PREDICTED: uncharacterized protein LOC108360679 [Rhagoletis zephyria]
MRVKGIPQLQELLEGEAIDELDAERDEGHHRARDNIAMIQAENRRSYDRHRQAETEYTTDELVAIKRTQYGSGLKLKAKYLGPYKVVKIMRRGRYTVEKVGDHEGPNRTITVAEFMKRWDPSSEAE